MALPTRSLSSPLPLLHIDWSTGQVQYGGRIDTPAVAQAERTATIAGVVTIIAGPALTLAPAACGKPIGMDEHPGLMRAIGISDVLTAPGLLFARPRWPWLTARAALNAGLAAGAVKYRLDLGDRNWKIGAAMFAVLTALDGMAAMRLHSAGR